MSIVVYAEASRGAYPGHMVLGQESADGEPCYFGYRFDPANLPEPVRPPDQWRGYLFDNAVRGMIVDETEYVGHLFRIGAVYYEKRAECDAPVESRLPPRPEWEAHAWYSFNPDDPPPEHQPCYNCVKWAIAIANALVVEFLPPVPQGRLKRVLEHLRKREQ